MNVILCYELSEEINIMIDKCRSLERIIGRFYEIIFTVDSVKTKVLNIVTDMLGCKIISIGSGYNIHIFK